MEMSNPVRGKTVAFALSLVPSMVALSAIMAYAQDSIPLPTVEVAGSQNQNATTKKGKSKSKKNTGGTQQAKSAPAAAPSEDAQTGSKVVATGSAKEGYKVDDINLGQMGDRKIQDVPFSVNVASTELAQNRQANTLADIVKYFPSVQISDYGNGGSGPSGGSGRLQTRGFVSAVFQNTRIDGLTAFIVGLPIEGYQSLEVLNGLTGSLYGVSNPAGTFNLVQKRPTATSGGEVSGNYRRDSIGQGYIDANTGDFGNGMAVRFTGLYQDGEGWVPESRSGREFSSLAFDWHLSPQTTIETNFTRAVKFEKGFAGQFIFSQNALGQATVAIPKPIDPTLQGYGQSYHLGEYETDTATVRVRHDFNKNWSFNAGALYLNMSSYAPRFYHTLNNDAGDYTTRLAIQPVVGYESWANTATLNGKVEAFGLLHDLVLGSNGYSIATQFLESVPNVLVGKSNINNPTIYPYFYFPPKGETYTGTWQRAQNLLFSDTVTFNEYWQVMLTGNEAWIDNEIGRTPFSSPGNYSASGFSSSASLIFKPTNLITSYFTYASTLQEGDLAPASATNANQPIAPYRSEQYEAGVKVQLFDLDVTAAVFQIERPFANVDADGTYKIIGNQVNSGLEFFTAGRISRNTSIFGGITLIDPKLEDTNIPTTSGKDVVNVPKVQANMLVEYDVPELPGLTVGANVHYTGRRAADNANTAYIDSFTTLDLSARYTTIIAGYETIFRLNVNNVTNTEYWASVLPSNLVGSGTGTYALTAGRPLDVFGSVSMKF